MSCSSASRRMKVSSGVERNIGGFKTVMDEKQTCWLIDVFIISRREMREVRS